MLGRSSAVQKNLPTYCKQVSRQYSTFLPYAPQVQAAVDKLVEESALYVVDDGPRARLYRLT